MKKFGLLVGATVLLCVACGQQAAQAAKEITLAQYTEKANALTAEVYSSAVATMSATYNGQSASVSLNYTYSEATGWVANATTEQEKAAAQSIDKIIGEQAKELAAAAAMTPATLGYTFRFFDDLSATVNYTSTSNEEGVTETVELNDRYEFNATGTLVKTTEKMTITISGIPEEDIVPGVYENGTDTIDSTVSFVYSK